MAQSLLSHSVRVLAGIPWCCWVEACNYFLQSPAWALVPAQIGDFMYSASLSYLLKSFIRFREVVGFCLLQSVCTTSGLCSLTWCAYAGHLWSEPVFIYYVVVAQVSHTYIKCNVLGVRLHICDSYLLWHLKIFDSSFIT